MVRGVATTGQEKEKKRSERHLIYTFCWLLPVAKQLHTSHSLGQMQGCKGKWMLSAESQVNMQRWSKTCRSPEDSPSLTAISHVALAYTTASLEYKIKHVLYAHVQATTWPSFRLQFLRATNVDQLDKVDHFMGWYHIVKSKVFTSAVKFTLVTERFIWKTFFHWKQAVETFSIWLTLESAFNN